MIQDLDHHVDTEEDLEADPDHSVEEVERVDMALRINRTSLSSMIQYNTLIDMFLL